MPLDSSFQIRRATPQDCDELLHLYFAIYGKDYPLTLGTDRDAMLRLLRAPASLWLVAYDSAKKVVASLIVEVDEFNCIGKAQGLAVHPSVRRSGLAKNLIDYAARELLNTPTPLNSIFATTRTLSLKPQLAFLREKFLPLGIFPNAHRLEEYETLTLMARHSEGALARRQVPKILPASLLPLKKVIDETIGLRDSEPAIYELRAPEKYGDDLEFELIDAPAYVMRRFYETFSDPYQRYFPFNEPNFLMSATNGEVEIFAHKSSTDGYCTIVALTKDFAQVAGRLRKLLRALRYEAGVSYIELLVDVEDVKSLEILHYSFFIPSGYYPAMLERQGGLRDYVMMTRTMEPLDFRGMEIEHTFKPFVDSYVSQWKQMHLDVLGVFNEYELGK